MALKQELINVDDDQLLDALNKVIGRLHSSSERETAQTYETFDRIYHQLRNASQLLMYDSGLLHDQYDISQPQALITGVQIGFMALAELAEIEEAQTIVEGPSADL